MDGVWFQPSPSGAWALAQYLAGDYVGAARAYRAHYRDAVASGWSSGDPALDALLAGDLDRAASAARTSPSGERGFLLTMADLALERGRPDEALTFLRQALLRAPDDADALLLASLAHARADEPGAAIVDLTHALRQSAAGTRVTTFLRILETTGDLATRQGAGSRPCLLAHYHRYLSAFDASSARRALGYAEQAIRAADRPADAHVVRGILLDRQGQRDRALEAFLKALEIDPRQAEAYRRAAFIYSERGDLRGEYRLARAAFDAAPTDSFYLDHLDHLLTDRLADPRGLTAVMQRAVEANPDNARARERLGWALRHLGRGDDAVAAHRPAPEIARSEEPR
jgi:tetratricopeptide (TPR) repeat protein